ncbi:MAG: hypothetical protein JSR90_21075 [Proteobacteria bacterium]|nr:hypothetical protein [Pseudomonadota bacterium]
MAALLCALCLTGCGPAPARPILVNRTPPAELVRPCPAEPAIPAVFMDDREMATWTDQAVESGRECRAAHRALSDWAKNPPQVK